MKSRWVIVALALIASTGLTNAQVTKKEPEHRVCVRLSEEDLEREAQNNEQLAIMTIIAKAMNKPMTCDYCKTGTEKPIILCTAQCKDGLSC